MLLPFAKAAKRFTNLLKADISYFDNFTQKINPPPNSYVSYMNPKYRRSESVRRYEVPLHGIARRLLQESKYRQFREKMIGVAKEYKLVIPDDPLWGPELPRHYMENRPFTEYYKIKPYDGVIKPPPLPQLLRYNPEVVQSINRDNLPDRTPSDIIQYLLKERSEAAHETLVGTFDLAQKLLAPRLPEIALIDLVRLRHALLGSPKYGSQKFLVTVKRIIHEEYKTLDVQGLFAFFVTERFERHKEVQEDILGTLLNENNIQHFTQNNEKLLEFVECYAHYRVAEWKKDRTDRVKSQAKIDAINVLSKLPLQQALTFFTNQQKLRLMRCFHRMKLEGFKHFLYKIAMNTHQQQLSPKQAAQYIQLLSKLQSGVGYLNTQQLENVKPMLLQNWQSFNNLQKLKIIHLYWNMNHSWEEFKPLYESVPVEPDASILYYFVQIQITDSSGREHEILRAMAEIDYIPIPYFAKFKQWMVFADSFRWNLIPLSDKILETEWFMNCERVIESLQGDPDVIALGKFLTVLPFKLRMFAPVQNFTVVQYAYENQLIGVEVTRPRDIAPNGTLKKQAVARNTVLQSLGWYLIQLRWKDFSKEPAKKQYKFLQDRLKEIIPVQEQKKKQREHEESIAIFQYKDILRGQKFDFDDYEVAIEEMIQKQQEEERIAQGLPPDTATSQLQQQLFQEEDFRAARNKKSSQGQEGQQPKEGKKKKK